MNDILLVRLLRIAARNHLTISGMEAYGVQLDALRVNDELLDLVLDAVGLPSDQSDENGNGFCRDGFFEDFLALENGSEQECHDYLRSVQTFIEQRNARL